MDTTLLSATNSSNCSRRDGGICALTVLVRFSLRMDKKAPGGKDTTAGGEAPAHNQGGGEAQARGNHAAARVSKRRLARFTRASMSG